MNELEARSTTEGLRVLLVDDDLAFGTAMGKALRRRGYQVRSVDDGATAVAILAHPEGVDAPQVAVLDLRMPGMDGLEVLRRTPGRHAPVIVLTGHGTVPDAVECMRLGAYTFLTKPVDAADLAPVLEQAARPGGTETELVGISAATAQLRALLERLANADEPVLLTGETGTGKEVAARTLHRSSRRAAEPFVAVNMACLPRDLVESELFGHARGAFTGADRRKPGLFEEAAGGTLFLDEVAELPLEHQAKLLRVLETRQYRPVGETRERPFLGRLVTATHRDLRGLVARGAFREDLFYRLQVLPLELPPLRHRRDDILPIAEHWLHRVSRASLAFTDSARVVLQAHDWPGNVREVVNLARRVALFADDGRVDGDLVRRMLTANPFPAPQPTPAIHAAAPPPAQVPAPGSLVSAALAPAALATAGSIQSQGPAPETPRGDEAIEEISLEALEQRHIRNLLARHQNITHVAKILEINRRTLQRKLRAWGIESEDGDDGTD
jgi:two-component system nitrogen regulation response regulator GlnG